MRLSLRLLMALLTLCLLWTPKARAIDPDNPWMLDTFVPAEVLEQIDPTDRMALQNILQGVYRNPNQQLSSAEEQWFDHYHGFRLQVDRLRDLGRKRQQLSFHNRCRATFSKTAGLALGTTAVLGLGAGLFLWDTRDANEWEKQMQDRYGLHVYAGQKLTPEHAYLVALLEAEPGLTKDRMRDWLKSQKRFSRLLEDEKKEGKLQPARLLTALLGINA